MIARHDLRHAQALKGAPGQLTPEQSETLAQAFSESTEDNVATKLDIAEVKTQIAQLKSEVADLRTELKTDIAAFRTELAGVRTELKTDIAALRTELAGVRTELKTDIAELKTGMASLKVEMVRWIVGSIAFNLLGTLGLMIGVAELVSKAR